MKEVQKHLLPGLQVQSKLTCVLFPFPKDSRRTKKTNYENFPDVLEEALEQYSVHGCNNTNSMLCKIFERDVNKGNKDSRV